MLLTPGTRIGSFEVIAPLGAGGMGEVYRARDSRLGREVAIKVLPALLAGDAERLARFDREARVLAAMNHPGIASIFGVEDAGGHPALVMELVEGATLAERIERGPVSEEEVHSIARQLAEAIEYAHELGIVHRDLKPANVKLRSDGVVKVLDFGLARAIDPGNSLSATDLTKSPTLTQGATAAGVVLGTAAYMAPEQARGRVVDRRADIWAFGAVLYEMFCGRRPFAGETISETLAAVMRDEPDWNALPKGIAPGWRRLLARCMTKDVRARLQAMGEARIALDDLNAVAASGPGAEAKRPVFGALRAMGFALLGAALAATLAWFAFARGGHAPQARELSIVPPAGLRFEEDRGYNFFALAPDGLSIAYSVRVDGVLKLRLRRLDERVDVELPGTDGARNMFFSPDGAWIVFFNSNKMQKISVHGGLPVAIADAGQDRLGAWLDDGTIVYTPEASGGMFRVPATGGTPAAVTQLDAAHHERTHRYPTALGGGPWVAFTVGRTDSPGGYDDSPIDVVNVRTKERRRLATGARRAVFAAPDHLILDRSDGLYAVHVDPRDPKPAGEPVLVLDHVGGDASSGAGHFSIARNGTLAYVPADPHAGERMIGWFDRAGRWTATPVAAGPYLFLSLSADGARAIVAAGSGGGSSDLWLADLASGQMNRLTYGNSASPGIWLPDGERLVYPRVEPAGGTSIMERRLDGAGAERMLFHASWPLFVTSLTADGRRVLVNDYGRMQGRMRLVNLDGDTASTELAADPGNEFYEHVGMISPDGQWLAYVSNRTHREEVFVRSLTGMGGRWQVSAGGGAAPRWGRDSHELFFVTQGSDIVKRVTLRAQGNDIVVGQPEDLFVAPEAVFEAAYRDFAYDRSHDRFLATRPISEQKDRREIALSLGWVTRMAQARSNTARSH